MRYKDLRQHVSIDVVSSAAQVAIGQDKWGAYSVTVSVGGETLSAAGLGTERAAMREGDKLLRKISKTVWAQRASL